MNKSLYPKLAFVNMKKHARSYVAYMITCIFTIALFYIILALSGEKTLDAIYGLGQIRFFLEAGIIVIAIFALIFLFYTHSFITKQRKKEFALYNILGMEKKHVSLILFYETLYCSAITLIAGLGLGILLFEAAALLLQNLIHAPIQTLNPVSVHAVIVTLLLFGGIYMLIFIDTFRQIRLSSPAQLLRGEKAGEKEPKANFIFVLAGLGCIGGGYYISLTTDNILQAINLFLVAVILVIIGTYFLFTSVTIIILKLLRKNKKYYYKTNHFTFVSGMLYRMKQNAVGLATICILSTMVLVMLSVSILLYANSALLIRNGYPRNIKVDVTVNDYSERELCQTAVGSALSSLNIEQKNVQEFYLSYMIAQKDDNSLSISEEHFTYTVKNAIILELLTQEDASAISGEKISIENENDVYIYCKKPIFEEDSITICDNTYHIEGHLQSFDIIDGSTSDVIDTCYVIFKDKDTLKALEDHIRSQFDQDSMDALTAHYVYGFDLDLDDDEQIRIAKDFHELLKASVLPEHDLHWQVESAAMSKDSFYSLYGGMLFLGLFLGFLFLMAAVLIIYYKQISEGYEDRSRFDIMQKVGMTKKEVRQSIRSQVLSVFYMPLIVACIHTAFAFPIIKKLLTMMMMTNTTILAVGMISTMLVFAIFYTLIYMLTAKVYYKIVAE